MGRFHFATYCLLFFICLGIAYAKPNAEALSATKTVSATLYLVELEVSKSGGASATFAWVPIAIDKKCHGISLIECRRVPVPKPRRFFASPPQQVLTAAVSSAVAPRVFAKLKSEKFYPQADRTWNPGQLEDSLRFRFRVKWELWSNGENFEILDFTP